MHQSQRDILQNQRDVLQSHGEGRDYSEQTFFFDNRSVGSHPTVSSVNGSNSFYSIEHQRQSFGSPDYHTSVQEQDEDIRQHHPAFSLNMARNGSHPRYTQSTRKHGTNILSSNWGAAANQAIMVSTNGNCSFNNRALSPYIAQYTSFSSPTTDSKPLPLASNHASFSLHPNSGMVGYGLQPINYGSSSALSATNQYRYSNFSTLLSASQHEGGQSQPCSLTNTFQAGGSDRRMITYLDEVDTTTHPSTATAYKQQENIIGNNDNEHYRPFVNSFASMQPQEYSNAFSLQNTQAGAIPRSSHVPPHSGHTIIKGSSEMIARSNLPAISLGTRAVVLEKGRRIQEERIEKSTDEQICATTTADEVQSSRLLPDWSAAGTPNFREEAVSYPIAKPSPPPSPFLRYSQEHEIYQQRGSSPRPGVINRASTSDFNDGLSACIDVSSASYSHNKTINPSAKSVKVEDVGFYDDFQRHDSCQVEPLRQDLFQDCQEEEVTSEEEGSPSCSQPHHSRLLSNQLYSLSSPIGRGDVEMLESSAQEDSKEITRY